MSSLAKSLRELYFAGSITLEKVNSLKETVPLTQEEYEYIVAPKNSETEYEQYYNEVNSALVGGE